MTEPVQVDPATLRDRLSAPRPPRIVDVREPAEFAASHLPGAHNVPLGLLRGHRDELARHLGTDVVLVCASGARAERAAALLAGGDGSGARVLAGGMDGWAAAGGPVTGGRRWALERQIRLVAGLLVLLGMLGSLVVPGLQWFAAVIGAALVLTALLGVCPMGSVLARMPWNRERAPDVRRVVARLAG